MHIEEKHTSPNLIGELFREMFFKNERDQYGRRLGCYEVFTLAPGVKTLPNEPVDDCPGEWWTCAELTTPDGAVKMRYHWEGDGTLQFFMPDGTCYENTDCKKDYEWEIVTNG